MDVPSYTTTDLEYSLRGGTSSDGLLDASAVASVLAAWGVSEREYADWTGGFLLELVDGRFAYLSGWSDTSGWGCRDGAEIEFFDQRPDLDTLVDEKEYPRPDQYGGWDLDPADLNAWLAKENGR